MSCKQASIEAEAKTIPVRPPIVNIKIKPRVHKAEPSHFKFIPRRVASQEKILTPVGIATMRVEAVKKARESTSIPTVYIWCPHTMKPMKPILKIA